MTLIDTNVIIDILTHDPRWFEWSMMRLSLAAAGEGAMTNAMVGAELARDYAAYDALEPRLNAISVVTLALEPEPAFQAGKAFAGYRMQRNGDERRILPDFFIGAHALSLGLPLLTRDPRLYRRYFPHLTLITPETHP